MRFSRLRRRCSVAPDTASPLHADAACGCAGVFSAPNALACLAQTFEDAGHLDKFEPFVSRNGAAFYNRPVNEATLTLERTEKAQPVPDPIIVGERTVTVFDPIRPIHWRVVR